MAKKAVKKAARKGAGRSTRGKKLRVPFHSVVHFVQMLNDEGHIDQFVEAAEKYFITLDSASQDFVTKYLKKHELHGAMAAKVVDPCPNDPFRCNFR